MPPPRDTASDPLTLWARLELVLITGTIPAFYLAALSVRRPVTMLLYGAAAAASAIVVVDEWRRDRKRERPRAPTRLTLSGLLIVGLVLCAAMPQGDALDLLLLRLGTAMLVVLRAGDSIRPWFWRDELARLLIVALGLLALCGLGFWWLEPQAHSFGDGVWLAFTTAATVGYGDIVPSTPASKIFAVFVVFLGFTTLSLVTASVAAMWVQTEERKIENTMLHELHREMRLMRVAIGTMHAAQSLSPTPVACDLADGPPDPSGKEQSLAPVGDTAG